MGSHIRGCGRNAKERFNFLQNRRGTVLSQAKSDGTNTIKEESREQLAQYCENHGIAAACLVMSCSQEDLGVYRKLALTSNLPELREQQFHGK